MQTPQRRGGSARCRTTPCRRWPRPSACSAIRPACEFSMRSRLASSACCDLAALVGISESAVSHQLRLLRSCASSVAARPAGMVYYALDDHHILEPVHAGPASRRRQEPRGDESDSASCTVCELHAESIFRVEGMDCHEEVAILERRLKNLSGLEALRRRRAGAAAARQVRRGEAHDVRHRRSGRRRPACARGSSTTSRPRPRHRRATRRAVRGRLGRGDCARHDPRVRRRRSPRRGRGVPAPAIASGGVVQRRAGRCTRLDRSRSTSTC